MSYNDFMQKVYQDIKDKYNTEEIIPNVADTPGNLGLILIKQDCKLFLRLNTPNSLNNKTPGSLKDEIRFICLLKESSVPAVDLVEKRDGEYLYSFQGFKGYATKWLDLKPKEKITKKDIEIVSQTLAKMHNVARTFKPKYRRKSWSLKSTKYYLGINSAVLPKELYSELSSRLTEINLSYLLPSGYIHEDLGKRHFLWEGDRLAAILDFDRAYQGLFVCDLAQAVRGWCIEGQKKISIDFMEVFLNEYNRVRKLNVQERRYFYNALRFASLERANAYATKFAFTKEKSLLIIYEHFLCQDNQILRNERKIKSLADRLP